jgi:hypothetical protein
MTNNLIIPVKVDKERKGRERHPSSPPATPWQGKAQRQKGISLLAFLPVTNNQQIETSNQALLPATSWQASIEYPASSNE